MKIKKVIAAAIMLLVFQVLYYQLTLVIIRGIMQNMPYIFEYFDLMLHHTIQFGLVFIPTLIIHRRGKIDFGYHVGGIKGNGKLLAIGCAVALVMALYNVIFNGYRAGLSVDLILFQLLFSGLGEEIAYRAIPMAIMKKIMGENTEIIVKGGIKIDIAVLISAVLFGIGHISFRFGSPGVSVPLLTIISATAVGIVLGYAYKKTNSIWYCMCIHGVSNVVAVCIPAFWNLKGVIGGF